MALKEHRVLRFFRVFILDLLEQGPILSIHTFLLQRSCIRSCIIYKLFGILHDLFHSMVFNRTLTVLRSLLT